MKKIIRLSGLLLFILLSCTVFNNSTIKAATPVEKWGQLKVSGTNIGSESGKKVQLKGVSTHGIAWFPQYVNASCFRSFRKMGVNTIRLALYSDPNAGFSTKLYKNVEDGVKYATELGMYVIIDWHILSDGNPKKHQKQALKFFTHFAKKYKKQIEQVLKYTNQYRKAAGQKELVLDTNLTRAACYRSLEMAKTKKMSHTRPDGSSCFTILKVYKVNYMAAGENIAYTSKGYGVNAKVVSQMWYNSPGHRANMLSSSYGKIGIGIAVASNGDIYYTQLFTN